MAIGASGTGDDITGGGDIGYESDFSGDWDGSGLDDGQDQEGSWDQQLAEFNAHEGLLEGGLSHAQAINVRSGIASWSSNDGYVLNALEGPMTEEQAKAAGYNDVFGWQADATFGQQSIIGYMGPAIGYKVHSLELFGYSMNWMTDVHYNVAGQELGFVAEIVADIADMLGVGYTTEIGSSIESGISFITAALTSAFTGASIAPAIIQGVVFAFDLAYANNQISFETQRTVKALGTIASFGLSTVTALQNVMSLKSMSQYMSTEAKILGYTMELVSYGVQVNSVLGAMQSYGLSAKDLTAGNIYGFDASMQQKAKSYDTFEEVLDAFASWNASNTSASIGVVNAESDPFEWKAGGVYYESQFAGSSLYVADEPRKSETIAEDTLGLSYKSKQFILGESAVYQDLQQVDTKVDGENEISYASAQIGQLNQLVSTYSGLIEEYNAMVNSYNSTVESYESEGYSSTEIEDLTSRKDALDTLGTKITSVGEAITDLRTQFNI